MTIGTEEVAGAMEPLLLLLGHKRVCLFFSFLLFFSCFFYNKGKEKARVLLLSPFNILRAAEKRSVGYEKRLFHGWAKLAFESKN